MNCGGQDIQELVSLFPFPPLSHVWQLDLCTIHQLHQQNEITKRRKWNIHFLGLLILMPIYWEKV